MSELIRDTADLKKVVDRRLQTARENLRRAYDRGETLDYQYMRGQERELEIMQDLLCILLDQPRTYAAATR